MNAENGDDAGVAARVYFSGPTFLVLAEISLDRGVPPLLKYTLVQSRPIGPQVDTVVPSLTAFT